MNTNYFRGTVENPYHISIGVVLKNNEGKICCHYFKTMNNPDFQDCHNFYLLMRETIEPNETVEEVIERGLMEEFGAKAILNKFLGTIVSHFSKEGKTIEKTTLYFLCDYVSMDESKRKKGDVEAESKIIWMNPAELIMRMKEQRIRLKRSDIDESSILERL